MQRNDAILKLWKIEYTALVNQLNYEILKDRWRRAEGYVGATGTLVAFAGLLCGIIAWLQPTNALVGLMSLFASAFGVGVIIMLAAIPLHQRHQHNKRKHEDWTELRGLSEQLHVRLESSTSPSAARRDVDELLSLIGRKSAIEKREMRCDEPLIIQCQRDINKRTYGVKEGTYEQVQQSLGLVNPGAALQF